MAHVGLDRCNIYETRSTKFIALINFAIILLGFSKISSADSDSCPISRDTVKIVDICPVSEEEWRQAAARKNCTAFANQCSEPDKLVYHCVIDPYVNQLIEVCAYAQNIVLGHCTDYSINGNLIEPNQRTNCKTFTEKPCPDFYRSNEAYKYPGCYDLTMKTTTVIYNSKSTSNLEITVTSTISTSTCNMSTNSSIDISGEDTTNSVTVIVIAVVFAAFAISIAVIGLGLVLKYVKREKSTLSTDIKPIQNGVDPSYQLTDIKRDTADPEETSKLV